MRLGIDVSTYFEEMAAGAKYYDGDKQIDPLKCLRDNGVDCMRIRLWLDPFADDGAPYLGGTTDFNTVIRLTDLASTYGFGVMLDFHFSDFWADPGKQMVPKAWRGKNLDELVSLVGEHVEQTLLALKERNVDIQYIQVGNEITNGTLWPHGRLTGVDGERVGYENLTRLLKAGCASCRKVYPNAQIVLHLEKSYDQVIYNEFFTNMQRFEVDFDVIGFSYYPYWHGTFEQFFANVDMCKKFGKKLVVTELGYAFTLEDYIKTEHGAAKLVVSEDNLDSFAFVKEYPITPQGQADFTRDFLRLAEQHGIETVVWWEPLWLPGEGICWASTAGQDYIGESGKSTRNEWANQCLFDYQGRKLPAFDCFKLK